MPRPILDRSPLARVALALALVLALALAPAAAAAQAVAGRVVEDPGGTPAAGAIVTLVSPTGWRLAPTVTDSAGRYAVAATAPGAYRLRVDLIGYETWLSPELALGADIVRLDVQLPLRRVRLAAVTVAGATECTANPQDAPRTVAIWEEVRRALTISGIAERQRRLPFDLRVTRREVAAWGAVQGEERARLRSDAVQPWVSANPAFLAERGYVRWERDTVTYFVPGAEVLLSDEFLATHCFTPVRRRTLTRRFVGLAFAPVASRALPDVAGTIWLDEGSSELRTVEFTFRGVPERVRDDEPPGGEYELARLPSGLWYIRRWSLRVPMRALDPADTAAVRAAADALRRLRKVGPRYDYVERVGEATVLRPGAGRARPRELPTVVSGVVTDSTAGTPLVGARVTLPGEPAVATDAAGRYEIAIASAPDDSVAYVVAVSHPRFAALGATDTTRTVMVRRWSVTPVDFAVPAVATLTRGCAREEEGRDARGRAGLGLVVGRVRAAGGTTPPAGTPVRAEWPDDGGRVVIRGRVVSLSTATDAEGRFVLCGVPVGRELVLRAAPGEARVTVGPNGVAEAELVVDR